MSNRIAGPVNLNKQPLGLLDFLAIKNGGVYPQILSETLAPTLQLLDLYETASTQVYGTSSANLVAGLTLFGPAGAVNQPGVAYHYRSFGVRWDCTAAAAVAYVELGICPNATTIVPITPTAVALQAVASQQHASLVARDVWVPPGWQLGFRCFGLVGGANPYITNWHGVAYAW